MRAWHIVSTRLRSLLRRAGREADLREELQLHLEREAERLHTEDGFPPDEAMAEARRRFGGVEWTKELCRDARGTTRVEIVLRDVRYAARRLARDWRFTAAAVLILGLGIGANTAIFSLIDATLFRKAAVVDAHRLVDLYQVGSNPNGVDGNTYPAFQDMAAYTDVFADAAAVMVPVPVSYLDRGALRSALVEHATPSYPRVLGIRPSLGRWYEASEDRPGAAAVAVVGYEAWRRRFDADPAIVGRTLPIEGVPVTIVGVGPAGHRATIDIGLVTDFWMPVHTVTTLGTSASASVLARKPREAAFSVKARLRDGVTVAQAQAAMGILGRRLAAEYPTEDPGKGISVVASRDVRIHPQMDGALTAVATVLQTIVALVLAIAASNLATLLLVRGTARAKEISLRLALGASRGQLVRHLLIESLLLAVAGCAAGCVLAWWVVRALAAIELPIVVDLSLDYRVLAFAAAMSLITGVAFGLAPALKATRVDLVPALRGDGEVRSAHLRRWTLKDALVAFQVALSVLLLGGTSMFLQLLHASRAARVGFAVDGVALVETDARFAAGGEARTRTLFEDARRRITARPGVQAVAVAAGLPMQSTGEAVFVGDTLPAGTGHEGAAGVAGSIWAGPGVLETLRIPILFGRSLDERDRPDTPAVAVVSEAMARQFLGVANPADAIGRRFRLGRDGDAAIEVVGVAADAGTADRQGDLVEPRPQMVYRSYVQGGLRPTTLIARTTLDAAALAADMQRDLRAVDTTVPIVSAQTMAQYLEASLTLPKALATFIGGLGTLGLGLAAIGLYAVITFAVARQTREIGIRMALGAHRGQAVWTVARGVATLVGAGTAAGLGLTVLAILGLRAAAAPAPGITLYRPSVDPLGLLGVAAFVALVAAVAAFGPARRAATVDPLIALRRD